MEIHELSPEQEQVAEALELAFNAMVRVGVPLKEAVQTIVAVAKDSADAIAA